MIIIGVCITPNVAYACSQKAEKKLPVVSLRLTRNHLHVVLRNTKDVLMIVAAIVVIRAIVYP